MRILHVITTVASSQGGPVEGIRQISAEAARQGHTVEVVSSDIPDSITAQAFPGTLHPLGPALFFYGFNSKLVNWLRRNASSYDIVVANGVWQFHSLAVWLALRNSKTPYVVFTHGMLDPWFKRNYPLKHFKKWLYWPWFEYKVVRDAAAVLFTSNDERLLARQSFGLYQAKEVVIHYGTAGPPTIQPSSAQPFFQAFPRLKGKRIALFLGRIHPKKGCDLALQSFAEVLAPESDWHLVMAGPNNAGLQPALMNLAEDLNITGRVTWTGLIEGSVKWDALHCAEFLLLPSHQENFGIVVAEALASGLPVLMSNKVNIWREVLEDGAGLVGDDNLSGTVALLQKWVNLSDEQKSQMRRAARDSFEERFEIKKAVSELITTYSSLAAGYPIVGESPSPASAVESSRAGKAFPAYDPGISRVPLPKQLKQSAIYLLSSVVSALQVGFAWTLLPIAKLFRRNRVAPRSRILVVSMGGIGDNVLVLPTLKALRGKYPKHEIIMVLRPYSMGISDLVPGCVDREIGYTSGNRFLTRLLEPLRTLRFVISHGLSNGFEVAIVPRWDRDNTGSSFLSFFSFAKRRLTFSEKSDRRKQAFNWLYDSLYTDVSTADACRPEAEKIAALISRYEDVPVEPVSSFLQVQRKSPAQSASKLIAIAPFAGQARRDWPIELWRKLLKEIPKSLKDEVNLEILCSSQETDKANEIISNLPNCTVLAGLSFTKLVGRVSQADLFIGADSGLAHLAGAAGVPVLELCCHPKGGLPAHYSSPARYAAASPRTVFIQPLANPGCEDACEAPEPCCIKNISVRTVVTSVVGFFASLEPVEQAKSTAR